MDLVNDSFTGDGFVDQRFLVGLEIGDKFLLLRHQRINRRTFLVKIVGNRLLLGDAD